MPYLTRLILNPRCRQVQCDLRSPYEMHRTLLRAFPDGLAKGESRGVLWRVDPASCDGQVTVHLQSKTLADFSKLPKGYLVCPPQTRERKDALYEGQRLVFRLRANPTVKRNGKRFGIVVGQEQIKWLHRKASAGGFHVISVLVTPYQLENGEKADNGTTRKLSHLSVQFDGLLEVTDPVKFLETLRAGIGSAKGFGFGLLSLARPEASHALSS
jgi:CRISPR system Cascade subunit CasE